MKTRLFEKCSLGLALSLLAFVTGSFGQASDAPQGFFFATNADAAAPPVADMSFVAGGETPFSMAAPEPARPTDKPLPPTIRPTSPTAEVIKLTQSGVDENVMLAFIANSTSTFNLGSDEIIYLNDLGVPDGVVTAMIQHDQALNGNWSSTAQASAAAAANAQAAPAYETPPPAEPPPAESHAEPAPPADMSYFYSTLSPYGSWVSVDGYGWCWQPTVVVINPNWQPYCDRGRWIYTDCGWYWLSDYSWGWAPFHYGRWFRHERLGWCWTPDTVWAPAWVSWRYSNEYCGWAPLPPAAYFRPGFGLAVNGGSVGVNFDFGLSVDFYTFVPWTHFRDNRPYRYVVARRQAAQVFNNTVVINDIVQGRNNVVINRGIPPQRVASFTRTEVRPVAIQEATGGGRGGRSEQLGRDGRTLFVQRPHFTAAPKGDGSGNGGRANFSGSAAGPAQSGAQVSSQRGDGAGRAGQPTTTTTTTPPSPSPRATPSSSVTVIGRSNAGQMRGGQNSSSAYNTPRGPAAQAQQRGSVAVTEPSSSAARNNLPQQPARLSPPQPATPPAPQVQQPDVPRVARGIEDRFDAPQSAPAPASQQIAPQYNSAPPARSAPPPAPAPPRQSVESRPAPAPAPAPAPRAESPQSSGSGSSRAAQDQTGRSR